MEYPFASGLILEPEEYRTGLHPSGSLSPSDKEFVLRWYPPAGPLGPTELVPFGRRPLRLAPGEQADFAVEPTQTREYAVGAFGTATRSSWSSRNGTANRASSPGRTTGARRTTPHSRSGSSRAAATFVRVRLYSTWRSGTPR